MSGTHIMHFSSESGLINFLESRNNRIPAWLNDNLGGPYEFDRWRYMQKDVIDRKLAFTQTVAKAVAIWLGLATDEMREEFQDYLADCTELVTDCIIHRPTWDRMIRFPDTIGLRDGITGNQYWYSERRQIATVEIGGVQSHIAQFCADDHSVRSEIFRLFLPPHIRGAMFRSYEQYMH